MTPRRQRSLPLSYQIYQYLREELAAGEREVGSTLPAEADLAHALGVSRTTVRRALDFLEADGLIDRIHGRGTVVRRIPTALLGYTLQGDLKALLDRSSVGRESTAQLSIQRTQIFAQQVRQRLDGAVSGKTVRRVLTHDGEPYGLVIDHVPKPFAAEITARRLQSGGVLGTLDRHGVPVVRVVQTTTAVNASAEIAELLSIPAGSALLQVSRVAYTDPGDAPVDFATIHYPPGHYRDVVEFIHPHAEHP